MTTIIQDEKIIAGKFVDRLESFSIQGSIGQSVSIIFLYHGDLEYVGVIVVYSFKYILKSVYFFIMIWRVGLGNEEHMYSSVSFFSGWQICQ